MTRTMFGLALIACAGLVLALTVALDAHAIAALAPLAGQHVGTGGLMIASALAVAARPYERKSADAAAGGDDPADEADEVKAALETLTGSTTKAIGEMTTQVKSVTERLDGLEKRMNRPGASSKVAPNGAEESKAVAAFVRRGDEAELKAMSIGSDPDGGYLVHPVMSTSMTKKIFDQSPMRRLARVETITVGNSFVEPIDFDDIAAGWVAETDARPETATPQVGELEVPVHEIYAMPKVSQQMVDDSAYDIVGWLEGKVTDRFARIEGSATILGNGIKKPRGLLTYPTSAAKDAIRPWGTLQTIPSGNATQITADGLKTLTWSLRAPYRPGAVFMMNTSTAAAIDKLKDDNGAYIWRESMIAGQPPLLLGYPVVFNEDLPDVAAGSLPIAFGDFRQGYLIVDKAGIRWLRDPYSAKPWLLVYAYRRTGGALANSEAVKLMTVAAN